MALILSSINLHTKCYLMKGRRTPSEHRSSSGRNASCSFLLCTCVFRFKVGWLVGSGRNCGTLMMGCRNINCEQKEGRQAGGGRIVKGRFRLAQSNCSLVHLAQWVTICSIYYFIPSFSFLPRRGWSCLLSVLYDNNNTRTY